MPAAAAICHSLREAIDTALKDKDIQSRLATLGIDSGSVEDGGAVLVRRIKAELPMWARVIKNAGIKTN